MESYSLNDVEAFEAAVFKAALGFFAVELLEKVPGRITKPEKWPAVLVLKKATVGGDDNGTQIAGWFGSGWRHFSYSRGPEDNENGDQKDPAFQDTLPASMPVIIVFGPPRPIPIWSLPVSISLDLPKAL
jgi:hypothetical protein